MALSVTAILNHWAHRSDVFYDRQDVLDIVAGIEGKLVGQSPVTVRDADRLGNGFELRAAIEILEARGCTVKATEEGFYHRITELVVSGVPSAEPLPVLQSGREAPTGPEPDAATRRALTKWGMRADMWFEPNRVTALVAKIEARLAREVEVVVTDADRLGNGYELRAIVDSLRAKGFQVETTEVGFYHRITEIRVRRP